MLAALAGGVEGGRRIVKSVGRGLWGLGESRTGRRDGHSAECGIEDPATVHCYNLGISWFGVNTPPTAKTGSDKPFEAGTITKNICAM
jgi:hypothetical protein